MARWSRGKEDTMVRWTTLASTALSAAVLMMIGVRAQQNRTPPPAGPTVLTPADYIEIQQLAVRYSYALDSGAGAGEMLANLFAADGAFISATRGRIDG